MEDKPTRTRPRASSGPLYLYLQMQALRKVGLYKISVDEADMTKWTINLPSTTLTHFGMPALACDLCKWASLVNKEASIVLAVSFPTSFPRSVPFHGWIK